MTLFTDIFGNSLEVGDEVVVPIYDQLQYGEIVELFVDNSGSNSAVILVGSEYRKHTISCDNVILTEYA
jgi:hypothetical protein